MTEKKKLHHLKYSEIKNEIFKGHFGQSGDLFMTTEKLANKTQVSLVTAQKIMDLLKENGVIRLLGRKYYLTYEQLAAKTKLSLNFSKSKYIGLHVHNLSNIYIATLASKVEEYARKKGFQVLLCSSNKDVLVEKQIMNSFFQLSVAGVISCPSKSNHLSEFYQNYPLPLLFLSHNIENTTRDSILVDNYGASKAVAQHLIKNNYKNFAYVSNNSFCKYTTDTRLQGFSDGLKEFGFDLEQNNILILDEHKEVSTYLLNNFLFKQSKPLAIFCYHDLLAVKVHDACRRLNLSIPADIGIVGFDNLDITEKLTPKISSVDYRIDRLVENALETLIEKIKGLNNQNKTAFINTVLMVRDSSRFEEIKE